MRRIPSATFKDHLKLPGHRRLSRSIPKTVRLQRSYCTIRKRSKSHQHRSASSCPRLLHRNRRRCVGNRLTRSVGPALAVDDKRLARSEEHTSELQSRGHLVCRLLLEKKKTEKHVHYTIYKIPLNYG